jgi:hypothetical protein
LRIAYHDGAMVDLSGIRHPVSGIRRSGQRMAESGHLVVRYPVSAIGSRVTRQSTPS